MLAKKKSASSSSSKSLHLKLATNAVTFVMPEVCRTTATLKDAPNQTSASSVSARITKLLVASHNGSYLHVPPRRRN